MFSRFFNINHKKDVGNKDADDWKKELDGFQSTPSLPKLDSSAIRVLIYKETASKKTLLFDSDAVSLVSTPPATSADKHGKSKKEVNTPVAAPQSPKYQKRKPKGDVKMFGEMVFGNLAMVYKGAIIKVHLIRSPPQLLMTKVFALRSRSAGVNFCDSELASCGSLCRPVNMSTPSGLNDSTSLVINDCTPSGSPVEGVSRSFSTPVEMKREKSPSVRSSQQPQSLLTVPTYSTPDLNNLSLSSVPLNASPYDSNTGSLRHRMYRCKRTSLDSSYLWRSRSAQSEEFRTVYKHQPKIGVGIIFNLWENADDNRAFQNFFFTHFTLFESHLQSLRVRIEKSFYLKQKFVDAAVDAIDAFKDDVYRLCYAPRIMRPVWLNLTSNRESKEQGELSKCFIDTFLQIYKTCENKECSYFLSNLLTAVLTHHLSWVNTVMSSDNRSSKNSSLDKYSSKTFDVLAKCHPYNPLWAQIYDLYGCLGTPVKVARTVIVGKNVGVVKHILEFVSYFIRCCEVKENVLRMESATRDSLKFDYRQSDSNCSDTLSMDSQSSNNTHSWFERRCNIVSVSRKPCSLTGDLDPFKEFTPYSHLDSLKEEKSEVLTCTTTDTGIGSIQSTDILKILKFVNVDASKCHCALLQALKKINDNKLKTYVRLDDVKHGARNTVLSPLKNRVAGKCEDSSDNCCVLCRTLEKGMFEEFCENCKLQLVNLNVEVDVVCLHCAKRLDRLKTRLKLNAADPIKHHSKSKNSAASDSGKFEKNVCLKKPSFVCYCCSPSTYGDVKVELYTDVTLDNTDDDTIITRPRNTSDPVDFVPKPGMFSSMRNSTNSHDSGTEMECSSCATADTASEGYTRTNSLSSQVSPDLDSDYCSVENEQLASTLTDCITPTSTPTSTLQVTCQQLVCSSDDRSNCVIKSSSVCTLKAPTVACCNDDIMCNAVVSDVQDDVTFECNGIAINNECTYVTEGKGSLGNDLIELKLRELDLPRSTNRQLRRSSSRYCLHDPPSIGKSMFGGYSQDYMPNMVLQGCRTIDKGKLVGELQKTVKYSTLDEEVADAVCIVADTDTWSCEVLGISKRTDLLNQTTCEIPTTAGVYASDLVSSLVESTKDLCSLNMPADFCLLHIEEQLRDLYNRSKVFAEYSQRSDDHSLPAFFGYHSNDIDLLTAVGDAFTVPKAEDVSMLCI